MAADVLDDSSGCEQSGKGVAGRTVMDVGGEGPVQWAVYYRGGS
jgi:hypothetical protein